MRAGRKRDFARELRRRMTDAELRLWFHLRNRALMGCKFRRQHPIGPYVADFVCIERALVVEADGGQHAGSGPDLARTAYLHARGYRVLRFWNNAVLVRTETVLEQIHAALGRDRVGDD
ncbi:endonuclease domain-containing protein [Lysobacter sp. BMK333-48F3]|uniref:endonuclease domain-containing protein n=1 Tax=Lysobacter sp. BMK333-48F3 TaxID=2867962 RepID=UPI001C8B1CAF|nr:endonuclease domain-containing protein [Lysobacter sp. BMK333-48F3]MBX9400021.1 endonuclease domain-containing protein [Lysobacter sp. BMK333-48F3]